MSVTLQDFQGVPDRHLRRTLVSCSWLWAMARSADDANGDVAEFLLDLGKVVSEEMRRRAKSRKYHGMQLDSSRIYSQLAPGVLKRWKSDGVPVVRDPLTSAFFGSRGGSV